MYQIITGSEGAKLFGEAIEKYGIKWPSADALLDQWKRKTSSKYDIVPLGYVGHPIVVNNYANLNRFNLPEHTPRLKANRRRIILNFNSI